MELLDGLSFWDTHKAIDIGEWSICGGGRLERFYYSFMSEMSSALTKLVADDIYPSVRLAI